MRNTRKIIIALLIVVTLLASMATLFASVASTPTKLYLTPNSDWASASARFAAYFFGNGEKWVSMTDADGDGVYEVDVPAGYPSVIFCRMNPSATANNWDNKWNQTGDITLPTNGKNHVTINAGQWDCGSNYTWSTFCNGNHSWDNGSVTTAATCSAEGVMKYTCTVCSETKTESITKVDHSFENGACTVCNSADPSYCAHESKTEVNTATCLADGKHYYDCDNCDEIFDETEVQALGHDYVNGKCSRCEYVKTYFVNGSKWSAVYAYAWTTDPAVTWPGEAMDKTGETVNGFDVYSVEFDGSYNNLIFNNNSGSQTADLTFNAGKYFNLSDLTWYDSVDAIPEIDPLATGNFLVGEFNGWNTTANQFKLLEVGDSIAYLSLELAENTTYEFKVMKGGAWYGCTAEITGSIVNYTFYSTNGDNAKMTTTVAGTYIFALEGDNLSITYPHVHSWSDATCTEPQKCVCGETQGKANGHSYESVVTDPTCTEAGYTTHTCPDCKDTYTDTEVASTGHSYGDWQYDESYHWKECANCDDVIENAVHSGGEATETEKAVCETCEQTYGEYADHVHNFVELAEEKNLASANCEEKATYYKSCACGVISEETFEYGEVIAHQYDAVVTAPTCTAAGYTTHTCSKCKDSYTDSEVDPIAHSHVSSQTKDPTCSEKGELTWTCSCGDTYTTEIDMIAHNYKYGDCTACDAVNPDYTFYLVGYFNGADYYENGYPFVDGQLNIDAFDGDAYVYVKDSEGNSFWSDGYTEEVSATLTVSPSDWNKMLIPNEFEKVTYTVVNHKNGTVTLSYEGVRACNHNWINATCQLAKYCSLCEKIDGKTVNHYYADGDCVWCDATITNWTTVYVNNAAEWTTVYYYAWSKTETVGTYHAWPGKAMTLGENGLWSAQIPAIYENVIFCNGDGTQSMDLIVPADANVVYDNSANTWGELPHVHSWSDATCTQPQKCACGETQGDALGHSYESVVTEPTCIIDGYTTYTCSVCDDTYTADEVEAIGHSNQTSVTDSTCTEKGCKITACTECGAETVEDIAPKGHSFSNGNCSVCEAPDPDYVAPDEPGDDTTEEPGDDTTEQPKDDEPKEELNLFQKILKAITDFFANIGNWFKNLFGGAKN